MDAIIEVQNGSDWVICSSENQYQNSTDDGGGEGTSAKEENGGREWLSAAAMIVDGGVTVGFYCILWHVPSKINNRSEFRVSVRVHSVLGCTGTCGNTSRAGGGNGYNDVAIMNSTWHLHQPIYVLL